MPSELLISLLVEAILVTATVFLLVGPRTVLPISSPRVRSMVTTAGLMLLCLTFCWSVVFGCVLAIHQATARI